MKFKRIFNVILSCILLVTSLPFTAKAADEYEDAEYVPGEIIITTSAELIDSSSTFMTFSDDDYTPIDFEEEDIECIEEVNTYVNTSSEKTYVIKTDGDVLEKCKELDIRNVYFINCDAKKLVEFFENGQVSVIYLNFSDPWPKAKHAKRRLTFKSFLDCYKQLLYENGRIEFKTDNRPLFDFSLEQMQENGWKLEDICYDVHNSPYNENNIRTEYENNFSAKGFSINRVVAYKK